MGIHEKAYDYRKSKVDKAEVARNITEANLLRLQNIGQLALWANDGKLLNFPGRPPEPADIVA